MDDDKLRPNPKDSGFLAGVRSRIERFLNLSFGQRDRPVPQAGKEFILGKEFRSAVQGVWVDLSDEEGHFNPPIGLYLLMLQPRIIQEEGFLADFNHKQNAQLFRTKEMPLSVFVATGKFIKILQARDSSLLQGRDLPALDDMFDFQNMTEEGRFAWGALALEELATDFGFKSSDELVRFYLINGRRILEETGRDIGVSADVLQTIRLDESSYPYIRTLGSLFAAKMRTIFGEDIQYVTPSAERLGLNVPPEAKRVLDIRRYRT